MYCVDLCSLDLKRYASFGLNDVDVALAHHQLISSYLTHLDIHWEFDLLTESQDDR